MICPSCNKEFDPIRSDQKFCSATCRQSAFRTRQQVDHPVIPPVPDDHPDYEELVVERELIIKMERQDPYRYGYIPPHWDLADGVMQIKELTELMVSGGNRAGKTHWAARTVVKLMAAQPNMNVLCCHTSNSSSVTVQQPAIYNWLPRELRETKKGKVHYLNYSRKNGFTDGSFILPNGSRCDFLNYTQSDSVLEGREIDLIWADELVPQSWIDTLRFRLVTRRGLLIVTQTPLEGIASVWKSFTAGGSVLEWRVAPLLTGRKAYPDWPAGQVPRLMRGRNRGSYTVFFATEDNPYNPMDSMESRLQGAPITTILTRAYGWATESTGRAFPRFNAEVHVIPPEKVPKGGTLYQVVDPAGKRNYFCIWVRVYKDGRAIVVREFPDYGSYGEWVLPGNKADGKPGPAQTAGAGRSIGGYRELFRMIEKELPGRPDGDKVEEPMIRLVDPKAGGTPAISQEGGTTLIDLFAMPDEKGIPEVDEPMLLLKAPGIPPDQRIGAVNDMLSYDAQQPLTGINQPRLYVTEDCRNLIDVLSDYTGSDGEKGAGKDPADCLGMFAISSCEHVGHNGLETTKGGAY